MFQFIVDEDGLINLLSQVVSLLLHCSCCYRHHCRYLYFDSGILSKHKKQINGRQRTATTTVHLTGKMSIKTALKQRCFVKVKLKSSPLLSMSANESEHFLVILEKEREFKFSGNFLNITLKN